MKLFDGGVADTVITNLLACLPLFLLDGGNVQIWSTMCFFLSDLTAVDIIINNNPL